MGRCEFRGVVWGGMVFRQMDAALLLELELETWIDSTNVVSMQGQVILQTLGPPFIEKSEC